MSHGGAISGIFPQPTAVELGGRLVALREFRLRDLAALQALVATLAGDPLAGLATAADRVAALREAWPGAKAWPPPLGSAGARECLATAEGLAGELLVMLRTGDPDATLDEALDLVVAMTADEWARARRICWGLAPWKSIAAELDPEWSDGPPPAPGPGREPPSWSERVAELCRPGNGYTFDQVEGMFLSQWRALCSGGKPDRYRARPRLGESIIDAAKRAARVFGIGGD